MIPRDFPALADLFADIASQAGAAIMAIYADEFAVSSKANASPVTAADHAGEAIILERLAAELPGVSVIAEEAASVHGTGGEVAPDLFILVDPLDGTREFIGRNGEFTVNIALLSNRVPVVGAVYAPALNTMWTGCPGRAERIAMTPGEHLTPTTTRTGLRCRIYPEAGLTAAVSRSHLDPQTVAFLDRIPLVARTEAGSSLKFCRIAEGTIDVYPRFGPTMEWDTAAGHAVLAAAGGSVVSPDGAPFLYGKADQDYRNGPFIAWGGRPLATAQASGA
jgi:3'(2'), 5'-bisphosphate nucleotidase